MIFFGVIDSFKRVGKCTLGGEGGLALISLSFESGEPRPRVRKGDDALALRGDGVAASINLFGIGNLVGETAFDFSEAYRFGED